MPVIIDGTNGITQAGEFNSDSSFGFKNRIINGAMVIDQRNAGASGTANGYTVDRWTYQASQATKGTWQQNAGSVTPPVGFNNYLGFTSSSAYTVGSSEFFLLQSVTIAGDTSGTWIGATNGVGLYVNFSLGAGATVSGTAGAWAGAFYVSATGATSVVGTNGATFYITGVQLEVGSTATSFDYRPYTTELQLCQRYLPAFNSANTFDYVGFGFTTGTTNAQMTFEYYVPPRVAPTGVTNSAASGFSFYYGPASHTVSAITFVGGGSRMSIMNCSISGPAGGTSGVLFANSATAQLLFTGCEL